MTPRRSWSAKRFLLVACLAAGVGWGVTAPMATKQGVNFRVSTQRIPLYVKAVDFLHRHFQYQLLAEQITQGHRTDRDRVLAVFAWTRHQIRQTPSGWPIVDDHILHIIIRGHGVDEQMADVFTTLCTYAGVPAYWWRLRPSGTDPWLVLAFARVDGQWVVFDPLRGLALTDHDGRFVSAEHLAADPQVTPMVQQLLVGSTPYVRYFSDPKFLEVPNPLRARMQMPWPRLVFEVQQRLHLAPPSQALKPRSS